MAALRRWHVDVLQCLTRRARMSMDECLQCVLKKPHKPSERPCHTSTTIGLDCGGTIDPTRVPASPGGETPPASLSCLSWPASTLTACGCVWVRRQTGVANISASPTHSMLNQSWPTCDHIAWNHGTDALVANCRPGARKWVPGKCPY